MEVPEHSTPTRTPAVQQDWWTRSTPRGEEFQRAEGSPKLRLGPGPQKCTYRGLLGQSQDLIRARALPGPRTEEKAEQVLSTAAGHGLLLVPALLLALLEAPSSLQAVGLLGSSHVGSHSLGICFTTIKTSSSDEGQLEKQDRRRQSFLSCPEFCSGPRPVPQVLTKPDMTSLEAHL